MSSSRVVPFKGARLQRPAIKALATRSNTTGNAEPMLVLPSEAATRALIASIAPATWLMASPAWSEEAVAQAAAVAEDVSSSGSGDLVVNVMFSLVTLFLTVVTGGVSH